MKRATLIFFALGGLLAFASCRRAAVKEDFVSTPNVQLGSNYPMVNSERRVRVAVVAPYALSVKLDICGVQYPLQRRGLRTWVGESDPLDEGFHYYQLQIDGASVPDPSSEYYYGSGRWGSGVDIPSSDQDFYAVKNVPQGQLRSTYYWSEVRQEMRHIIVYTPAEYDRNPSKRYPVLYLLPGGAENEYSWARQGHLAQILDNLMAGGEAEPFLAVVDNCQGVKPWDWIEDYDEVLAGDLMPMIDSTFRTLPDAAHRAMAGLSYGGYQTKLTALAHPELFDSIGLFSGGTITVAEAAEHPGFIKDDRLVFISFGSKEIDNPTFGIEEGTDPHLQTEELRASGVNAVYYLSPETHHEWHCWRRSMYQFAKLLFKGRS